MLFLSIRTLGKQFNKSIAYSQFVVAEEGSAGNCARVYTATTYSDPVLDEECDIEPYEYTAPDGFMRNAVWKEYVAPLVDPVCDVEDADVPCVAAGVKFETAAFVQDLSECLYGYYDYHMDDVDPVYMEITAHTHDWTASPCYLTDQIVTKLRGTKLVTGSGRLIRQQERSTLQYEGHVWTTNPAFNEAYGTTYVSDMNGWYDTYHLTIRDENSQHLITGKSGHPTQITYTFAFPTGMGKQFESLINGYVVSLDNPEILPVVL